jgi:hypothetical protein
MIMDRIIREEARLIVLKALAQESDYSLNESLLQRVLEAYGLKRSRDWIRDELRRLCDVGAVTIAFVGEIMIATLTTKGRDHVEQRLVIEGVKRPSPPRE